MNVSIFRLSVLLLCSLVFMATMRGGAMDGCDVSVYEEVAQCDEWRAGDTLTLSQAAMAAQAFRPRPLPASVLQRMRGLSLPADDGTVDVSSLRYIPMLHYTLDKHVVTGEMVVAESDADDVAHIFRRLYEARYPVECIRLIDDFGADDEQSMRHNNTSSFCYRAIAGGRRLSKHARGLAVDLNPLYNPCFDVRGQGYANLQPTTAAPYVDRSSSFPYKLTSSDLAVRLFKAHGFRWGGDWKTRKDYQHFEK